MNVGTQMTKSGAWSTCKTLTDLVAAYEERRHILWGKEERSEGHHDPVVDFCKEAPNFLTCIRRAVEGRRRDGKVFSEGSCVRIKSKRRLELELTKPAMVKRLKAAKDFEQVYDSIREVRPWGIGNLTVYCVASRIAAYRGIHTRDYVYLHAGPLQGWKRLTRCKGNPYRVAMRDVPKALRRLPPHLIEDMLCEVRDAVHPGLLINDRERVIQ